MDVSVGDRIRFDGASEGAVVRTMLDRDYDRGVMIRRYEPNGQPDEMWVSESRIDEVIGR